MADYCTLAEVKSRMPELGAGDDALITSVITAVSRHFDHFTGRSFEPEAATLRVFSGNGTNLVFINPMTLASAPTLVRVRANAQDAWRTVTAGDVRLMPEGRRAGDSILWLELLDSPTGIEHLWPAAHDTVEITATWGRLTVPEDVREACIQTVVNLYRSRGSAGTDMEGGMGGVYMPDIPKAMPLFAYSIMKGYRKLVLA